MTSHPAITISRSLGSGGTEGTLRLPLTMTGGQMSLGPVPLGPAPRF